MAPKTNRKVRLVLAWTYDADHAAAKSGKWTAKDDGTLWCWSWADDAIAPYRVGSEKNWKAVSATGDEACAQKTDGTLWCFALRSFALPDFPGNDPARVAGWSD